MVYNKFTTIGKIYVWSVVLEPILYLVVAPVVYTGVDIKLGRILQFIVIIGLLLKLVLSNLLSALIKDSLIENKREKLMKC